MPPQQSQPNTLPMPQAPSAPPQGQPTQPAMNPETAKAGLGIATHLQSFLLPPKGTQDGSKTPKNAPGQAQTPPGTESGGSNQEDVKTQMSGLENRLMDELQTLKAEMKSQSDSGKELADLKKQIEQILASSD